MADSNADLLENFKSQLSAVEHALQFDPATEQKGDLMKLQSNLLEVIFLLEGTQCTEQETCKTATPPPSADCSSEMDAEFARFQMEISELGGSTTSQEGQCNSTMETSEKDEDEEFLSMISSLGGTKCSAPFSQEWGEKCYHNAIISSVDFESGEIDSENFQVKVMFCNPTCDSMKPCPFYLDGHCKFSDDKCRYSHGNKINISEIRDFKMPDFSSFTRDSICLAKYDDGLWYKAVVENCLDDSKFLVKYSNFGNTVVVDAVDVIPLGDQNNDSESETEDASPCFNVINSDTTQDRSDEVRPFLSENSGPLGIWEKHTKGIGSKLMVKMGYVIGQGLGKNGEGRLDPVEAIILPKGKSLDKCIELRDQSGHMCPVSVESRVLHEKRKEEQRIKNHKWNGNSKNGVSVFDFINSKISIIKDDVFKSEQKISLPKAPKTRASSSALNRQSFAVAEDIKKAKRELKKLYEAQKRNETRYTVIHSQVNKKIAAHKEHLKHLCIKEQRINREMKDLKTHEKLTCF